MADLFNGLFDNTIGRIPGVSDSGVGNVIKSIADIPAGIVGDIGNVGLTMFKDMASLSQNMIKASSNLMTGLANTVSSPLFSYLVIGGLGLGFIYVITNPKQSAQAFSTVASYYPPVRGYKASRALF